MTRKLLISVATAGIAGATAIGAALAASLGVSSTALTTATGAASISPTTCTLSAAIADSYVDGAALNTGTNYGSATTLDVRSSASGNRRTFVHFALATCSIPANALVTTASLKVRMYAAPAASSTYDAHRVTASWTENGITWSSQPAVAASATASVATGTTSNVTLTWNVTTDVRAFVDGTVNNGWRIMDQTEGSLTARTGQFRSAEYGTASDRPVLEITYYP